MTPIFIINRNRLTTTKTLVEWLLSVNQTNITIIDNESTYEPLLEWYSKCNVEVKYMGFNGGPYILWTEKLDKFVFEDYIVTDSDLVPSEYCPSDVVDHLVRMLSSHPDFNKVGVGLRVDNIPDNAPWKYTPTIELQAQYWNDPVDSEVFRAAVDTTFALHRKCAVDFTVSLRTNIPYTFDHVPWYKWPLDEEEKYYLSHASGYSSWSRWKAVYGSLYKGEDSLEDIPEGAS